MTPRDAARSRHPSSGGPGSPPGATGRRLPTILAALLLTVLLPILGRLLPFAATILACWLLGLTALVAVWAAVCELARARRRRQLNRHIEQAMRVVE